MLTSDSKVTSALHRTFTAPGWLISSPVRREREGATQSSRTTASVASSGPLVKWKTNERVASRWNREVPRRMLCFGTFSWYPGVRAPVSTGKRELRVSLREGVDIFKVEVETMIHTSEVSSTFVFVPHRGITTKSWRLSKLRPTQTTCFRCLSFSA